ncbi:MAG: hypothetical protein US83_C0012G0013 [Candidatus Falkowbacteria bacterium GW2011_GWC2_38_22]|uniref:Uncharacterized protein n=1 Tax=Candidatus Falkowbacteria bacterium GW2011_GWE1_38_31 TaxID=1618638 RepID=A0A0G0JSV2_9BACT|nr:MAG: hypothetical protein US73_C0010G0013 [Candidatus Falkowbacteria bacterium GW2011_GWF2_38_1205]KKQ60774.1 MAG: hypothetical protein US83_C0012G0013 [Candidatus Falkowbacteria bacterium GW2011_GWC2_38_22]KKQ62941.1 MAG: hypothetical protein US84_C0010G0013 [Candidatus Falkowbacteria bacterium GW2011_GWF1_38_22]KKQ64953.1 MAG: hypothetical protein US87_C0010G0013 [Candidatus Falkowbacteria bacterium GW2011_GWE2_38_254]KKQ69717.1 MAG: hypothetical protein US91_C0010G0013 [Candidatus Falkowb
MSVNNQKIAKKLIEILSTEKGYFGRVNTLGQKPSKYEYIGYALSEDFSVTLKNMNDTQKKTLIKAINYFEIHAGPLKSILVAAEKVSFSLFYEITWSQFMTVIMFGILEIVIKGDNKTLYNKGKKINDFLQENLSDKIKNDITERYCPNSFLIKKEKYKNFSEVICHLWDEIRSGFIHDGGIESRGLEWYLLEGIGTKEDPLTFKSDVPMQEFLQITWQAILNSFGYKGEIILPSYKK